MQQSGARFYQGPDANFSDVGTTLQIYKAKFVAVMSQRNQGCIGNLSAADINAVQVLTGIRHCNYGAVADAVVKYSNMGQCLPRAMSAASFAMSAAFLSQLK
jgi:hypothetical protein